MPGSRALLPQQRDNACSRRGLGSHPPARRSYRLPLSTARDYREIKLNFIYFNTRFAKDLLPRQTSRENLLSFLEAVLEVVNRERALTLQNSGVANEFPFAWLPLRIFWVREKKLWSPFNWILRFLLSFR